MNHRVRIHNWIDDDSHCCWVRCDRHDRICAQRSQYGQMYHSCTYWDQTARAFVPKAAIHPHRRCTVSFVFCHEHGRGQIDAHYPPTTTTSNNSTHQSVPSGEFWHLQQPITGQDATSPTPDQIMVEEEPSSTSVSSFAYVPWSQDQVELMSQFHALMDCIYPE